MSNPTCVAVVCGYLLAVFEADCTEFDHLCKMVGAKPDQAAALLNYLRDSREGLAKYQKILETSLDHEVLPPWEVEISIVGEIGAHLVNMFVEPDLLVEHLAKKSFTVSQGLAARFLIDNSPSWLRGRFPNIQLPPNYEIINYAIATENIITTFVGINSRACYTLDAFVLLPWCAPYEMRIVGRNLPMKGVEMLPRNRSETHGYWCIPKNRVRCCGDIVAFARTEGDVRISILSGRK